MSWGHRSPRSWKRQKGSFPRASGGSPPYRQLGFSPQPPDLGESTILVFQAPSPRSHHTDPEAPAERASDAGCPALLTGSDCKSVSSQSFADVNKNHS